MSLRRDIGDEIGNLGASERKVGHSRMVRYRQERCKGCLIEALSFGDLRECWNGVRTLTLPRCHDVTRAAPALCYAAPVDKIAGSARATD
ncbi:hypothetical protein [Ensifer sp. 4252]|uniref:hypothetical protein n=1 Tax=Ensifer sp. 4252 TaxID=3373915 RepID=UPI003D1D5803